MQNKDQRISRLEGELAALRAWSLDVFPDLSLPPELPAQLQGLREEGLTFLAEDQLVSLACCVHEAEIARREGALVETGAARGGSAIAMALAKAPHRPLYVYDVFGEIPPPGDRDGVDVHARYADIVAGRERSHDDDDYYGYRPDLKTEVTESFDRHGVPLAEHNVTLVEGLFQDTLTGDWPVALAHVDGDWYDSTRTCLERIAPRLVPQGRIIIDDYYTWSGCRDAVHDYFDGRKGFRLEMRAKVHVVRTGP